jgi:rare lipoprotein A
VQHSPDRWIIEEEPMQRASSIALWLASAVWWSGCQTAEDTKSRPPASPSAAAAARAAALPRADSRDSEPRVELAKEIQTGLALFLADEFQGRKTTSGEIFDSRELMAAHPSYSMGTVVRVTNLRNGRTVDVRVVDRGPSPKNQKEGALIDLSRSAAEQLDFITEGKTRVQLEVLEWGRRRKE